MSRNEKISTFLKDCLADALIKKMKNKPFEKITIDEIAETAGVGRATYFRHFSCKQEMLTYKIMRHWEINSEKRNLKERRKFDLSNALDFFEINLMQQEVLDLIYASNLQSTLLDAFYKIMVPRDADNTFEKYRELFYSYGLFGALDEWIRNGYKQSPQEMVELLTKITKI
ncbi:MAG: TetR/AcrR family transcriptional regulator [Roseburia sp.]|nr:TetR/AcrR family transcriptional regulator [Anaeroplasma bactoclasticum]MCM1196153.1 TetR/AcrR family transcriptional regulator [Roseburia sp.]MCM1557643.1 TetR/AcrR family transcriptional regulator [Anaeroplasma bactoclasticum]